MINAAWQDLKAQGAIGIHELDGILNVQMLKMDDLETCHVNANYASKEYDQYYKIVDGVKYFTLIKKEVL